MSPALKLDRQMARFDAPNLQGGACTLKTFDAINPVLPNPYSDCGFGVLLSTCFMDSARRVEFNTGTSGRFLGKMAMYAGIHGERHV